MTSDSQTPGIRVLDESYPRPVRAAEPEIRTIYMDPLVADRLADMLVSTFNFDPYPETTNWVRQHDPRPCEEYDYHSNLYRQLTGLSDDHRKLSLSWIQVMDLKFALRESHALPRDDPEDKIPEYEDHHLKVADAVLTRLERQYDLKA